jgi:hypothetical protein
MGNVSDRSCRENQNTPWSRVLLGKLTVNFAASQEIPTTGLVTFRGSGRIRLQNF